LPAGRDKHSSDVQTTSSRPPPLVVDAHGRHTVELDKEVVPGMVSQGHVRRRRSWSCRLIAKNATLFSRSLQSTQTMIEAGEPAFDSVGVVDRARSVADVNLP